LARKSIAGLHPVNDAGNSIEGSSWPVGAESGQDALAGIFLGGD
jgi:hypothetical protein